MTVTAPLPYLLYSRQHWGVFVASLVEILVLAGVASFWFVVAGRKTATDLAYLGLMAAPVLLKVFPTIYDRSISALAAICAGHPDVVPDGRACGTLHPEDGRHQFRFRSKRGRMGRRPAKFRLLPALRPAARLSRWIFSACGRRLAGCRLPCFSERSGDLWVLATAEEFFFRGLLQQVLRECPEANGLACSPHRSSLVWRTSSTIPELAIRCACHMRRTFLWAGLHPGPQHPGRDGDARSGCHRVESFPGQMRNRRRTLRVRNNEGSADASDILYHPAGG